MRRLIAGTGAILRDGARDGDGSRPQPIARLARWWDVDAMVAWARAVRLSVVLLVAGASISLISVGMVFQRFLDGQVPVVVAASAPADRQAGDFVGVGTSATGFGSRGISVAGVRPPALATADDRAAAAVAIHIPRLKVDKSLVGLHLQTDGSISVPESFGDIGWWSEGPRPGGAGATLVAGHVSSKLGPAVFFALRDLIAGDRITIDRADHTSAVFEVVGKAAYPRSNFPDDVVYRTSGKPSLHLVTCDGAFNTLIGHHEDNLVVFADLISTGPTKLNASPMRSASHKRPASLTRTAPYKQPAQKNSATQKKPATQKKSPRR